MPKAKEGNLAGIFDEVKGLGALTDPCRARMKVVTVERGKDQNTGRRFYSVQLQFNKVPKTLAHLQGGIHFENFRVGTEDDPQAGNRETWAAPDNWGARRMRDFIERCAVKGFKTMSPEDALKACNGKFLMLQFGVRVDKREKNKDGTDNQYLGSEQQTVRYFEDGKRPVADLGKTQKTGGKLEPEEDEPDADAEEEEPPKKGKAKAKPEPEDDDESSEEEEEEDEAEEEDDDD